MKTCIYGGQFGSEGKGSIAEAIIKKNRADLWANSEPGKQPKLIVFGENSPNSGHTNSVGKTRNIPVSAFFADAVIMGPDSVISPECLINDLIAVTNYRASVGNNTPFMIYIHWNAAVSRPGDGQMETDMVKRVSSTGSGSGYARHVKCFYRNLDSVVGNSSYLKDEVEAAGFQNVAVLNTNQYLSLIENAVDCDWLFECSQGSLLDVNFGYFPFVTSRSTLPRVAIERNGLGDFDWEYIGVYRTFPIRTGGPSGPTGGEEIEFKDINVADEIATVTKRKRRIFTFSDHDFYTSLRLNRPNVIAFTHLDYLGIAADDVNSLFGHLKLSTETEALMRRSGLITSAKTGEAVFHG